MSPKEDEKLDPRVKRTRLGIEQAFIKLVREKGFSNMSVQDVTEQAGINRATFYAHYSDKYALLNHAIGQSFRQEIDKRMLNACHFTPDNLRSLVMAVCEFVDEVHGHCAATEQQFQALVEAQVRCQIHELLNHWLEKMDLGENLRIARITPERIATAASWAIYGLAVEWNHAKGMPPIEQYADEVMPLVSASFGLRLELA